MAAMGLLIGYTGRRPAPLRFAPCPDVRLFGYTGCRPAPLRFAPCPDVRLFGRTTWACLVAVLLAVGPRASRADEANQPADSEQAVERASALTPGPAPLFIFHGPAGPPIEVIAARAALARFAHSKSTVLLDLSPQARPTPAAATELNRGIEAYRAFEYDKSLQSLTRAVDEAGQTGAAGLSPSELSDLHIYRGLVFSQLGDAARAWDDFAAAATVDPTRKLDPVRYSPRIIETFARATRAVQDAPFAQLVVVADSACSVFVDGNRVAAGEVRTVPYGHHYVSLECTGYAPYGGRLLVQQPQQRFEPALRKLTVPAADELRTLGRERGSTAILFVRAVVADGVPPTLVLRWIEVATGRERYRATVALQPAGAAQAAVDSAEGLLTRDNASRAAMTQTPTVIVQTQAQPWYRKPWVWGLAGVALTAAVLAPFVLDSSSANGFEVRPGGDLPPR